MSREGRDPFDEETLLDEARAKTGLEDFGDAPFREPLRRLLSSLARAPLNRVGETVLRTSIRRSLVQRLRTVDCFGRHPEIAEEPIRAPIVIVGMMRSGTTLLQRLMSRDPAFLCAYGWEIAEPAPRPGTEAPAEAAEDPRIADGIARDRQMRAFSPALHAIHPTDALEADEEIVFLADAFLSHVPEASCDVPEYRAWIDGQDFTPAYDWLRRTLQLLQWQKRRRGETGQRWVLKTPGHLGYLDTLCAVFPDAQIVHLHRSPLETVPSGASLNATLWRLYSDEVDPARVGLQWLERMAWATRRALAFRDAAEAREIFDLGYPSLVADPMARLEELYDALGLALASGARAAMERWLAEQRAAERPGHRYAAEDFGLSNATIRDAFADYLARFDTLCGDS